MNYLHYADILMPSGNSYSIFFTF